MNSRRTAARREGYELVNVGDNPKRNQVPCQVQAAANDQVLIYPLSMTDGKVRASRFQMVEVVTT